jgi:PAS domain S-box-containing protein
MIENQHNKDAIDYIKKILDHDFKYVSDVPDIPDKELSTFIKTLAEEYRDSLLRSEEVVHNLAITEQENKKLIEHQAAILNNSLVGIVLLKKRVICEANKKMAEIFGYDSPDEMIGKSSRIIYRSDEDFKEVGKNAYINLAAGKDYKLEFIAKRKDGSEFWCLLTGKSVNPEEMESADSMWIFQDISKEKENLRSLLEAQIKLSQVKDTYATILNNSLVGIVMVRNRLFIQANEKMAEIFGYDSPEDILGKSSRIVYASEEDFKKVGNNAYSALKEGKEYRLEYIAKRKDGSEFWCLLSGKSISSYDGGVSSDSVWVFQDITKEKEVDMMKTDFISTVSHELRTPLTSVMGFANIIRKKFKDSILSLLNLEDKKIKKTADQIESNLDIIISEGKRLTSLINDVLDIAKMEAGKIDWNDENLSMKDVIGHAVTSTVSLFEQKGLNVVTEVEDNLPEIFGDKDRFIQVLINLISNAVKFTDSGNITIGAKVKNSNIIVSVKDQGIGISKENSLKVFEKFKQVGDTLTDKPKGTGLGLPICKQIIEHYEGRIWVESEEGKGSTFCFTVPYNNDVYLDKTEEINKIDLKSFIGKFDDSVQTVSEDGQTGKNILIVDDDHGIREFLRQELEYNGYITDQAVDGIEALSKVRQKKYNLIILDVMMPGMSGFDLSEILKNNPDTMDIPIMILSMMEDKEQGFRKGADKYLTKGIDSDSLIKEVNQLIACGSSKHNRKEVIRGE